MKHKFIHIAIIGILLVLAVVPCVDLLIAKCRTDRIIRLALTSEECNLKLESIAPP